MTSITVNPATFSPAAAFTGQQSFAQKIINFTFFLSQNSGTAQPNTFAGTNSNQLSVAGLRSRVRITNASPPTGSTADISIWGLPPQIINQLTSTGVIGNKLVGNGIVVNAGVSARSDASAAAANVQPPQGFPTVFGGTIWYAFGDYNAQPEVPLIISATAGLSAAVLSTVPTSYTGKTSVSAIFQKFANQLKTPGGQSVAFENNGVSGSLSNPYFPGTLSQQIDSAARAAGINAQLVDGGTKLAIWPLGGARTSITNIPLVSPSTGMIGYPTFSPNGYMYVKTIFNPDITYGGQIRVQSSVPQANKTWWVWQLDLALDSLLPGGEWMAFVQCRSANPLTPTPSVPTP